MKHLAPLRIEALLSTHFLQRSTFKTFLLILFITAAPIFDVSAQVPPGYKVWGWDLPLDMSASDVVISGTNNFSRAGDVNGDGLDDFIVSPGGAVYVVFGSADGLPASLDYTTLDGSNGFVVSYEQSLASQGNDMGRAAGDINDDGFDDIIIGHPTKSITDDVVEQYASPSGQVYIVFGRSTFPDSVDVDDLDGTNGFTIQGIDDGAYGDLEGYNLGIAVNGAGDVNGDGFDDFLMVNKSSRIGIGLKAFVVFGKRDGFAAHFDLHALDGSNGFVIRETAASAYAYPDLSSAGDVNGDGADDILIGAQYSVRQQDDGTFVQGKRVFVVLGKPDGSTFPATVEISTMDGSNGFTITGENIHDEDNSAYRVHLEGTTTGYPSGDNVLGTGDINGDGVDDFMIGAPWAPSFDFVVETLLGPYESEQEDVGEVYVIFGRQNGSFPANMDVATLMNGTDGFIIKGLFTHGRFGWSLSADGDINSDGINDIIVGTPNSYYSTFAAVLYGKSTGFPASVDLRDMYEDNMGFVIENGTIGVGTSASIVGDMNGDGTDDFMLGTGNNRYPTRSSYVFYGEKKQIAPILSNSIADQQTQEDELFNFTIPDHTFTDQNPNDTQTLSAQLTGGDALPSWLTFDPETSTFSGTPLEGDIGTLSIEVTSSDEDALSVTDTFTVTVDVKADQTITFNALTAVTFGDADFELAGTSSSGLALSYTSSDETVVTVSESTVTILGAGTTTITANHAGDANYHAATSVDQTLTVLKKEATVSFSELAQEVDGIGKAPIIITDPVGLNFTVTYAGSDNPPSLVGTYEVVVTIDESNFFGNASASFVLAESMVLSLGIDSQVEIYPNPATGFIQLSLTQESAVELVNTKGVVVLSAALKRGINKLKTAQLTRGIYVMVIKNNSGEISKRKIFLN